MKSKKSVRDGKPVVIKLTSKGSLASIQYLKQAIEDGVLPQELADDQLSNGSLFISQIQMNKKPIKFKREVPIVEDIKEKDFDAISEEVKGEDKESFNCIAEEEKEFIEDFEIVTEKSMMIANKNLLELKQIDQNSLG